MYFSDPVLFEIPVLPRIKKFIAVKLADPNGRPQPLLATATSEGAGLMLWAMAQSPKVMLALNWRRRPGYQDRPNSTRVLVPETMTQTIGLGIREFHSSRHQYLLNYAELLVFSNFVDYVIQNELVTACEEAPDLPIMSRIKAFVDRYDFTEEELGERTLQQLYLRYRKGQSGFVFNKTISLQQHFQPWAMAA